MISCIDKRDGERVNLSSSFGYITGNNNNGQTGFALDADKH
jgi:hypothetical protein